MSRHIDSLFLGTVRRETSADGEHRGSLLRVVELARRAGFTRDYDEYREAYRAFFVMLDDFDQELHQHRFLHADDHPSAADEWLARILLMFESVFYDLYKLNERRLREFQNLHHYVVDVFSDTEIRNSFNVQAIRQQWYTEDQSINPKQRVPLWQFDFSSSNDRSLRFVPNEGESSVEENAARHPQRGEWKRKISGHRHWISSDGSSGFKAEPGRYHLYIANNCPWCHRAALTREIKGLQDVISMDVLYYRRDPERGWQFKPDAARCTEDSLFGAHYISEIYAKSGSTETSVPVLWDRETAQIVSNESAEIIRMFDQAFGGWTEGSPTLYPPALARQIDRINIFTYHAINNGAYKAGFADGQAAYEAAYRKFFDALNVIDNMLCGRTFLLGDRLTEADVRLFPTLFRFDPVYYTRFDLNERMVRDLPAVQRWLDTMLAIPAVAAASDLEHCREGYFGRNGNNIVPLGPATPSR